MAWTYQTEVSDGSRSTYQVDLKYTNVTQIHVYTGAHENYLTQLDYVWVNEYTIQLTQLQQVPAGTKFYIRRVVQRNDLMYHFANRSVNVWAIDNQNYHALFLLQELMDGFTAADTQGYTEPLFVGEATEPGHAVQARQLKLAIDWVVQEVADVKEAVLAAEEVVKQYVEEATETLREAKELLLQVQEQLQGTPVNSTSFTLQELMVYPPAPVLGRDVDVHVVIPESVSTFTDAAGVPCYTYTQGDLAGCTIRNGWVLRFVATEAVWKILAGEAIAHTWKDYGGTKSTEEATFIPVSDVSPDAADYPPNTIALRYSTHAAEMEAVMETGERVAIGGGGVPTFIQKEENFTVDRKKAYSLRMSDAISKYVTVGQMQDTDWFAVGMTDWKRDTFGQTVTIDFGADVISNGVVEGSTLVVDRPCTLYFQRIGGKWGIVDGIGVDGDYGALEKRVDALSNSTEVKPFGAVGDIGLMYYQASSSINPGVVVPGSDLRYSNTGGGIIGTVPQGMWRCQGCIHTLPDFKVTLFTRIS